MKRSAFAPALTLCLALGVATTAAAGQATPASTSGSPPAAPARAKFATPIKGDVPVQVIQGRSTFVGNEIVTTYKIKSMASGPIALLKVDEYWFDKDGKIVTTDTQRHRQPFQPGEIIEITTRAPKMPGATRSQAQFSHANGKVTAKGVKKFE